MREKFTREELRMLAESERLMDAGVLGWVMWGKYRMSVQLDIMKELNLQKGQTISDILAKAIMELQVKHIEEEIAALEKKH